MTFIGLFTTGLTVDPVLPLKENTCQFVVHWDKHVKKIKML